MSNRFIVKYIVYDTENDKCFYHAYSCKPFDEFLEAVYDAQELNKIIDNLEYEQKMGMNQHGYWLRKK